MKRFFLICAFVAVAGPSPGEQWNLREREVPLSGLEAWELTTGEGLQVADAGRSRFLPDGTYARTEPDTGRLRLGRFSVQPDGRVCIEFREGRESCNLFVRHGGVIWMLTESGGRFPVRVGVEVKP